MKNSWSYLIIFSLALITLFSCNKKDHAVMPETETYRANAKLKRIFLLPSENAKDPIAITDEYEYDDFGRITKVFHPFYKDGQIVEIISYDLYEYENGHLSRIKKMTNNQIFGFINIQNNIYEYDQTGKKVKEIIEYPQIHTTENLDFFYDKENRLIKTQYFDAKNLLSRYSLNEYDSKGQLNKEVVYTADNKYLYHTIHQYTNGLLTQSDVYGGKEMSRIREISRKYDSNKNLIFVYSKELSLLSSRSNEARKYEYFETGIVL
ncbi:MAG: hypothetical protein M9959_02775 [Chitinophagaceae bacterium]|nr:hypothetical protein [Chitinophagaceae bacterium]